MAWRAFSVFCGLAAWVAVSLGVSAADGPTVVLLVGYLGSIVVGWVVHYWVRDLPSGGRAGFRRPRGGGEGIDAEPR